MTIMPTMPECYRILGISPQAGIDEVKRRFRLLALKFHPDRNPRNPKAAARFREVAEAYGAICNRRSQRPTPPVDHQEQTSQGNRFDQHKKNFVRENLGEFFGYNDISGGLTSFGGPDFRYDLQIPFLAALWGLEKDIEFRSLYPCSSCQATGMQPGSYYQNCPTCGGRGRRWASPGQIKIGPLCDDCQGQGKVMSHPCPQCSGQGYRLQWKKYRIVIPPGVEDGARILFNGEGGEGFREGPPGHLVVVVHVEPHKFFTRHKNDLHCILDISFAQAVLGDSIEFSTPFGPRTLELPRGSKAGQNFIFPGLGVPATGNCPSGNLVITIQITNKTRFGEADILGNLWQSRTESK
jgi:molecular chaperone DnaJ